MHRISKLIFFVFLILSITAGYFSYRVSNVSAGNEGAFPKLKLPCDETRGIEFSSTRPYQAAPCGDVSKTIYCSNEIQFIETFDLTSLCGGYTDGWCPVGVTVTKHDVIVELSGSQIPILGNTEQVLNNNGGVEEFDDAQKMNEYLSWYLGGVTGKAEYGEPTDEQVVNYTGPLNKLLPMVIQQYTRAENIKNIFDAGEYKDEDTGEIISEPNSHDQIVVCEENSKAIPCDQGGKKLRLSDWSESKNLSFLNTILNILPFVEKWNERTPPFPWNFERQIDYQKAYNEWQGKVCLIVPVFGLQCADPKIGSIDIVPNKWSDLYQYLPLGNTTDKMGANFIMGDGPNIQGNNNTTKISPGVFSPFRNAPLYFPHAQYVKETSELLNKTFTPQGYESEKIPETTEVAVNTKGEQCTAVNVRVNKGDNLFPGDPDEMIVPDITYDIEQVLCESTKKDVDHINKVKNFPCKGLDVGGRCVLTEYTPKCIAEVYITIKTGTKTPNAKEIFATTVADSGSTFRKMFPRVGEGAPVECIADIPTVSDVTYNAYGAQKPSAGGITGDQNVKIRDYPENAASSGNQLTFPHIGSVYEYFLNGIQTALRPKGYGNPIANGNCDQVDGGDCSFDFNRSVNAIQAAAKKYDVPTLLLLTIFKLESGPYIANPEEYQCSEENEAGAIGIGQIKRSTYNIVTCESEKIANDVGMCSITDGKLSRCNIEDAAELMARVLLFSAGKWRYGPNSCEQSSGLTLSNKLEWYKATCNYGTGFTPNTVTRNYQGAIPENERPVGRDMNYCDVVCHMMGQCPSYPNIDGDVVPVI